MTDNKKIAYVDNTRFYEEIVKHKSRVKAALDSGAKKPQITNYLAECIMKIAENLAKSPKYSKYTWKDMMISDAIINCLTYFDNFDETRPEKNPFAYYTRIAIYAFHRRIDLEKDHLYTKYKLAQHLGIENDLERDDGLDNPDKGLYENIEEFIGKHEEKKAKKKQRIKTAKGLDKFIEGAKVGQVTT